MALQSYERDLCMRLWRTGGKGSATAETMRPHFLFY